MGSRAWRCKEKSAGSLCAELRRFHRTGLPPPGRDEGGEGSRKRCALKPSASARKIAGMIATAPTSESVKERWRTAGRFADVLEAEVKARRNPFATRVVSWFNLCRLCQDLEEQMLPAERADVDDQRLHRVMLSTAIASGEGLMLEHGDAEALKALRLSPEALAAKLESLRITFAQWHTEMKPERQAAILQEAFGGQV